MKEIIESKICLVRGYNIMLDSDLAILYGVDTKHLTRQVRRNIRRFPSDFMFQLNVEEAKSLRSQFVTSKKGRGGRRYMPYAFTEQGVAMLSSVLNSDRAIEVNIHIMRAFVRLRKMIRDHRELWQKIQEIEAKYDSRFKVVFDALRALLEAPKTTKKKIGFHTAK